MLVTFRLRFADRPDYDLAVETDDANADGWAVLRSRADREGRVPLGDHDSCRLDEIMDVEPVEPREVSGPGWERGLQDEDAAAAVEESYDQPTG
jgi:hypothetical protein